MDIVRHNQQAWDRNARSGCRWSLPVESHVVAEARAGRWEVILTPVKAVPAHWFPTPFEGTKVLGLASGGGQQMPVFAAAGADVTSFDLSPGQLAQDRLVADREGLQIVTVQGDARDLGAFDDGAFDLVFHPVSNCFIPELLPVWKEAFRVLRPGGVLLAAFVNPAIFIFEPNLAEQGRFEVHYSVPYSDVEQLPPDQLAEAVAKQRALEFGHTLEAQLGGQLTAGFVITDLYEDGWPDQPLAKHLPLMVATRAMKPSRG